MAFELRLYGAITDLSTVSSASAAAQRSEMAVLAGHWNEQGRSIQTAESGLAMGGRHCSTSARYFPQTLSIGTFSTGAASGLISLKQASFTKSAARHRLVRFPPARMDDPSRPGASGPPGPEPGGPGAEGFPCRHRAIWPDHQERILPTFHRTRLPFWCLPQGTPRTGSWSST